MKKFIIIKHGGGELANQLWNYVSIRAFGMHAGAKVENPSFFEYHRNFNFLPEESPFTKLLSSFFAKARRRSHPINASFRKLYAFYAKITISLHTNAVLSSENSEGQVLRLPPAEKITLRPKAKTYFTGWLFRNPEGLKQYREKLVRAFAPAEHVAKEIDAFFSPLAQTGKHIIGVHIRQGDYATFKDGKYFIDQKRVRKILDEFLAWSRLDKGDVIFAIASDGQIDEKEFAGLQISISRMGAVSDLFMLSKTELIIGSDSSFGAFASWYGDTPFIVMRKEDMDWQYYEDKTGYFENKYSTMARQ